MVKLLIEAEANVHLVDKVHVIHLDLNACVHSNI